MAGARPKVSWRRVLRYTIGGAVCLLTVVATRAGLQWYFSVVMLCVAFLIILGRRRIFRAGVSRTADEVVCRYIPWYEGNAYFLNLALPLIGVAMVAAGYAPGNPKWLPYGGYILLCLMPLIVFSVVSMWRRCYLRIAPSALAIRLAGPKDQGTEISRELVESITPKMIPNSVNGLPSLQVEIAYHSEDSSSDAPKTVLLGLQLTVQPANLLNALLAWKQRTDDVPSELLDRVERLLKGDSVPTVLHD